MPTAQLIQLLDASLPQTQCGLCGHPAGCLPYATAIAAGAPTNGCVPGGQPVADQLAKIMNQPPQTATPSQWPIAADGRPQRMKAVIREEDCIGCTKCLTACPVDAIIGSGKLMHSILTDLCTGCELCIPPCPVDCIDLVVDDRPPPGASQRLHEQDNLRKRYQAHVLRQQQRTQSRKLKNPVLAAAISVEQASAITGVDLSTYSPAAAPAPAYAHAPAYAPAPDPAQASTPAPALHDAQFLQRASLRSQIRKLQRQLALNPHDSQKQQQLVQLQAQLNAL